MAGFDARPRPAPRENLGYIAHGKIWNCILLLRLVLVPRPKLHSMDELEDARTEAMMSHQEITNRFTKLFGREMTPEERKAFFLPNGSSVAREGDLLSLDRISLLSRCATSSE
jgi:hypothetical protein